MALPVSSNSCLLIHIWWKVPRDERIDPPIHEEKRRSVELVLAFSRTLYCNINHKGE